MRVELQIRPGWGKLLRKDMPDYEYLLGKK